MPETRTQANAASAPNPMAIPTGTNESAPISSPQPVNPQGLTVEQMSALAGAKPSPQEVIQQSQAQPNVLIQGAPSGQTVASPAIPAAQTTFQAYTQTAPGGAIAQQDLAQMRETERRMEAARQAEADAQAARIAAGPRVVAGYRDTAGVWHPEQPVMPPKIPQLLTAESRGFIDRGLYGDDSGILSSEDYISARSSLAGAISSAELSPLNAALSASEAYAQNIIQQNIDEYNRLKSISAGTATDPVLELLKARQMRIAQQMESTVRDIHAQAEVSLREQDKLNKKLEGQTRAAINYAGQVGSMVGEGYLAAQLQNNLDALHVIRASEQKAITEARIAFENQEDDIAFKMVGIIEQRRQEANELLNKNFQIVKDMESMRMQRAQFVMQAKQTEMALRKEGRKNAVDFLSAYAKQDFAPEVIPDSVWNDAIQESGNTITKSVAQALYVGSLKDFRAKSAEDYSKNLEAFYSAAKLLPKDSTAILQRPNVDGSWTSIQRSEVRLAPEYESFEISESGKKYRAYLDTNDPEGGIVRKVPIGDDDARYEYLEDPWTGNTIQFNEATGEKKYIFDFQGSANGSQAAAETTTFIHRNAEKNGYAVTDSPVIGQPPIGTLSARYESSGDPGAIGYDATGGWSYGTYQLAHQNALQFITNSEYAAQFRGLAFNSPQFKEKWRQLAKQDPKGFGRAQHEYIKTTHYDPQIKRLQNAGIDINSYSPVLRDVVWSTAVQHGGNTDIVRRVMEKMKGKPEDRIIQEIYRARWGDGGGFASSTKAVQDAVYNRFFGEKGELNLALSRYNGLKMNPKDNGMSWHIQTPDGAPVMTNIKRGMVESSSQIGTGSNGKPMFRIVVRDLNTDTLQEFSGMKFSELQEGMTWNESSAPTTVGLAGDNGYSQSLYNGDGTATKPTDERTDIARYGSWGTLPQIPLSKMGDKARAELDRIRGDLESGRINLDAAVKRVKAHPTLSRVDSKVTMDDLSATWDFRQANKQAERELKEQAVRQRIDQNNTNVGLKMRDDFTQNPTVKAMAVLRQQKTLVNTALDSLIEKSQQGLPITGEDQAIIMAFQKMLDANSVVREAEYDRLPKGQAFKDEVSGRLAQFQYGGSGMTLDYMRGTVNLINEFFNGMDKIYQENVDDALDGARRAQVDPGLVVGSRNLKPVYATGPDAELYEVTPDDPNYLEAFLNGRFSSFN